MSEQTPGTVQAASPGEPEPETGAQSAEPQPQPQPQPQLETTGPAAAPVPGWGQQSNLPIPPIPFGGPEQAPKPKRPFPWRWVGAAAVTLALGAGCAFGVMAVKRTDVPGLKTAADGRYDFAPLTLPTLAPGQADPYSTANVGGQHLSDIRKLLLPAPEGATLDTSMPGITGWVSEPDTLKVGGVTAEELATDGWRHTAGTGWKTPDGAQTTIYLAQFIDAASAADASSFFETGVSDADSSAQSNTLTVNSYVQVQYEKSVSGSTTTWVGLAQVQDTEFLIFYKAPSSVGMAPFKQEVDLQVEMLQ